MTARTAALLIVVLLVAPWLPAGAAPLPPLAPAIPPASAPIIPSEAYDGGRIYFTSGGTGRSHIYRMEPDGANQVNFSRGSQDEISPETGPDGRILYLRLPSAAPPGGATVVTSGELWIMDHDGRNQRQVLPAHDPLGHGWSPTGDEVVYATLSGGRGRLRRIGLDGTLKAEIASTTRSLLDPVWSPSGEIVFHAREATGTIDSGWTIYSIPAAGPAIDDLKNATVVASGLGATLSPDGTTIAYVQPFSSQNGAVNATIVTAPRANPQAATPVASCGLIFSTSPPAASRCKLAFSPDGRYLAFDSAHNGTTQLYVARVDGGSYGTFLNIGAAGSNGSAYDPSWSRIGSAGPAVYGPWVAYQTGGVAGPTTIHLYDASTRQRVTAAIGDGLRLAGIAGQWLYYQARNRLGGYDLYVYDILKRTASRVDTARDGEMTNRPSVDANYGYALYRVSFPVGTAMDALLYLHDLGSRVGTASDQTESQQVLTLDPPDGDGRTSQTVHVFWSRYVLGDDTVAVIPIQNDAILVYTRDGTLITSLIPGQVSPAANGRPFLTLAGVSPPYVAVVERSAAGDNLLVVYEWESGARFEIAGGVDGPAVLQEHQLVWLAGGSLYRFHLAESLTPKKVADNVGGFALEPGRLITWLDSAGAWRESQTAFLESAVEIGNLGGEAEWLGPEPGPLSLQSVFVWNDYIATISGGAVSAICPVYFNRKTKYTECTTLLDVGDRILPRFVYYVRRTPAEITLRNGAKVVVKTNSFFRFLPSPTTEADVIKAVSETILGNLKQECVQGLGQNLLDYYKFLESGESTKLDLDLFEKLNGPIGPCSDDLIKAVDGRITSLTKAKKPVPKFLESLKKRFEYVSAGSKAFGKVLGYVKKFLDFKAQYRFLTGETFYSGLDQSFRDYLGVATFRTYVQGSDFEEYRPRPNYQRDKLATTADVLFKMVFLSSYDKRYDKGVDWFNCFVADAWRVRYHPGDRQYRIWGNWPANGSPNTACVGTFTYKEIAALIARTDGDSFLKGIAVPIADEVKWYYETVLTTVFPSARYLVDGSETIAQVYSAVFPQTITVEFSGTVKGAWDWSGLRLQKTWKPLTRASDKAFKDREPRAIYAIRDRYDAVQGSLIFWGTAATVDFEETGGRAVVQPSEGLTVIGGVTEAGATVAEAFFPHQGPIALNGATWTADLQQAAKPRSFPVTLLGVSPNPDSVVPTAGWEAELIFSTSMNEASVASHGALTVTAASGLVFTGAVGDFPRSWDSAGTRLVITPAVVLPAGILTLTLGLPPSVTALDGRPVEGSPFVVPFAAAAPIGPAGGTIALANGGRITVPPGAVGAPTSFELRASPLDDAPAGWAALDGLVHDFRPDGARFARPIEVVLPGSAPGARVFRRTAGGWTEVGGTIAADGSIVVLLDGFSEYAIFAPLPAPRFAPPPATLMPIAGKRFLAAP